MPDRTWSDGLARQVLAEAVYGDLIRSLPGAFTADLFGDASSPRARIAAVIEAYVKDNGSRPPASYLDTLIERAIEDRTEAEREAIADEWGRVQLTDPAENAGPIYQEVREWIDFRRMEQTLLDASAALGSNGPTAAREALDTFTATRAENEGGFLRFIGDLAPRLEAWRSGDIMGERIPTGFRVLDNETGGGPARKETWFFLAPPKGGKTTMLLNVAKEAMTRSYNVMLNTYEMQDVRMLYRLDQWVAKTGRQQMMATEDRAGNVDNLRRAVQGLRAAGAGDVWVKTRRTGEKASVRQVEQDLKRLREEGIRIDVVIFDYLNIMGSIKNEKEVRHVLYATAYEMADLAKANDVLVWSAALVNRQAVDKVPIRKNDIGESFGVIGAVDGAVAICSPPILVQNGIRRFYMAAAREERDEVMAGDYRVNFREARIELADSAEVDRLIASTRKRGKGDDSE